MAKEKMESYATPTTGDYAKRYNTELGYSAGKRTPFQHDRDRILYSRSFRRLMHKTQVFVAPRGDHFRTRLTHTLEVAQIARSIARAIGVNEDLTEAIALAHDLGHPPFGHAGEDKLDRLMRAGGHNPQGFDHNVQTLRLVTKLEFVGRPFDGLNLTTATLEGLLKHHGVAEREGKGDQKKLKYFFPIIEKIMPDFDFAKPAGLEAQCACLADEIAYNHHDLEDGLRAKLITIDQVCDSVSHIKQAYDEVKMINMDNLRLERRLISDLIGASVEDAIQETEKLIAIGKIISISDVQNNKLDSVALSTEQERKNRELKEFLQNHLYKNDKVEEEGKKASVTINWLFSSLPKHPEILQNSFYYNRYKLAVEKDDKAKANRSLADYISGMTDGYAYRVRDTIGGQSSVGIEELLNIKSR